MDLFNRPAKRVRKACDACRRKKSKCSGEQPICASCARLLRICYYASEDDNPVRQAGQLTQESSARTVPSGHPSSRRQTHMEPASDLPLHSRVASLESALAHIIQHPEYRRTGSHPVLRDRVYSHHRGLGAFDRLDAPPSVNSAYNVGVQSQLPRLPVLSRQGREQVAGAYLAFCWCQFLPLFESQNFVASFTDQPPELVYAVAALAINHIAPDRDQVSKSAEYAHATYQLVMRHIAQGQVELSTIQAICLLVVADIEGKYSASARARMDRSRMLCALASSLCHEARLHQTVPGAESLPVTKERHRCFWSVVLLHHLVGEQAPQLASLSQNMLPPFPDGCYSPPARMREVPEAPLAPSNIMQVLLTLSEPWSMAMGYIRSVKNAPELRKFPWEEGSDYSRATESLMNMGRRLPMNHRQRHIKLSEVKLEDLEQSRHFWSPWLCTRIMYHTIMCILNHPLLITLQIRGVQNVSEAFLHHAAFALSNHTAWIIHYLDFIESRGFHASDPLMGYCVAVLASIEVQRGVSTEGAVATQTKQNFEKCLALVTKMSKTLPSMSRAERSLTKLAGELDPWSSHHSSEAGFSLSGPFEILESLWSRPASPDRERGRRSFLLGPGLAGELRAQQNQSPEAGARLPRIDPTSIDKIPFDRASSVGRENEAPRVIAADHADFGGLDQLDSALSIDQVFHSAFQGTNIWPEGVNDLSSGF
ncbi:C6 transcription factor [Cordyceps militaris CM01]|uniref:C6 transcription factor n=1 Tax=Cordyceps militaris (strain CM01) TaxID=983644 RepID=G3JN20_CORMM|nr:C6 transcription factor [Cordyceps militaris CM01]EGX90202.1 C6 transcription factor [Cordyceps militaris CM01]